MILNLTLEDFEIKDLWTCDSKWNLLIEAREVEKFEEKSFVKK